MNKNVFKESFTKFCNDLDKKISDESKQWAIKGFIDINKNIYSISTDTKIVSKILEIHLLPLILEYAKLINYELILPTHQNYYPDFSLVSTKDSSVKFAVDIKTSYRNEKNKNECNGFTLGSFGEYFKERTSKKNIQFPYSDYKGHFCLCIIYDRNRDFEEDKVFHIDNLNSISSVISNIEIFFVEKWKIASDKKGSGNTANIGSIKNIENLKKERGVFSNYAEDLFDDYWINHSSIVLQNGSKINSLKQFLEYRGIKNEN